jgi:hypothetical protein
MTLDERLEALVMSIKLMSVMRRDVLTNVDKLDANMDKLDAHMVAISQLVLIHESRLKRLEGEGQSPGTA